MRSAIWVAMVLAGCLLAGCAPTPKGQGQGASTRGARTVQVKGSDTMINLNQALAESYLQGHRDVSVRVTGGGSGTGITALIQGTTDIAAASRAMTPEEVQSATAAGHTPVRQTIALDGIAVIVNPANTVKILTIDQLAAIFTGTVTNWKQVGGAGGGIVLLGREVNSGTHVFFKEHVLQRGNAKSTADYAPSTRYLPSTQAIIAEVSSNPRAVGYVGLGYLNTTVRAVPVAKMAGAAPVAPSQASVRNGTYPISRPLYYYTVGTPRGDVKSFVDYVLSTDGQQVVRELDFVPVK